MNQHSSTSKADPRGAAAVLTAALAVAALGTWVMYDALPGINWIIWTLVASAGLLVFARVHERSAWTVITMGGLAVLTAGGAAISANPLMHAVICLAVILYLAMQMLLAIDPALRRVTIGFAIAAPILAFSRAVINAIQRALEALLLVRSTRARATLRGVAITLPVIIVFALLLAVADPVFATWRNTIRDLVESWDFLPRTIFFLALLTLVLGVYGYAARGPHDVSTVTPAAAPSPPRLLGPTERLILLTSVASLFWLFLAVQLTYLFGNLPRITGSGMTFAEYARRGFAELTIVASASALLIIISERYGRADGRERLLRALTFAVLVAVLLLLASAFHRLVLYEEAYGFTIARVYAQAFMVVVVAGLVALATEVTGELDTGRLFRRTGGAAALVFLGLIYWNHDAWIARRNIDRFATTGKLDTRYLTHELSLGAIPAIIGRLSALPEPARSELRRAIEVRYSGRQQLFESNWFEWNLGRSRARDELLTLGVSLSPPPEKSR